MKRIASASLALTLALAFLMPVLLPAQNPAAPQAAPAKTAAKVKAPPAPEIIHPAYASLKEKTAVLVFLAWLWLIVGILVWLLRMKIREADRVHGLKFYPAAKDAPRPPTH